MENKSNNYSGYPITYERELPFDKSGSQFVNELPKKHDRTTAMATICCALGVITDSPSKDHLTDECDPIRFGLLYELTKSEDSKPEDSGSKWMKIYPEVEDLYRTIIIAQDELSPNARQRETRGVLEQRTFAKLTEKLEQKLLTSEPLDYVDYVLSLIHISEPTRQAEISYAVFCLKKKNSYIESRLLHECKTKRQLINIKE